jgi:hypothetical protein
MKMTLILAASIAALSTAAHADIRCDITDDRHNALSYVFTAARDPAALAEVSAIRNGVVVNNSDVDNAPYWNIVGYSAKPNWIKLVALSDNGWETKAWSIFYSAIDMPELPLSAGKATISHFGKVVGEGRCARLEAHAMSDSELMQKHGRFPLPSEVTATGRGLPVVSPSGGGKPE